MLLLFETAAGYALFKVLNKGKIDTATVRLRPQSHPQVLSFATHACSHLMCRMAQDFSADFESLEKAQQVGFLVPPPFPTMNYTG